MNKKLTTFEFCKYSVMKNINNTSLEEFYREAANFTGRDIATLLPPGISKEVGHFNVFDISETIKEVKKKMNAGGIRHSELLGRKIKKIAVLGGSGAFAISPAMAAGADVLITADIKYHEFYKAEGKMIIADIGHYESEQFTKNLLVEYLTKKIPNFAIRLSESKTNPIKYL